ncbi:MAG: ribosomal-processing cysteine protease Prp [Sporolactobacillus sp.]
MITLRVDRLPDGPISRFCLTGHAGSGPYGFDLVCAAVSAVSFGAINAIDALTDCTLTVDQAPDGGFLDCMLNDSQEPKAQLIIEAMLVSMRTIEQSYGKFLRIDDKGGVTHA